MLLPQLLAFGLQPLVVQVRAAGRPDTIVLPLQRFAGGREIAFLFGFRRSAPLLPQTRSRRSQQELSAASVRYGCP